MTSPATTHDPVHDPSEAHGSVHAVPLWVLGGVFAILLVLTLLTVAVTKVDLGPFNVWVALGIAVVKATLVALYFMHLRYESPFYGLVLGTALLFVAMFIGAALVDSSQYQINYEPPTGATAQQ